MTEIKKLYENAGVKPIVRDNAISRGYYIEHQRVEDYPPFTAEKQIELIKWMINKHNCYDFDLGLINSTADTFEEGIANVINNLWHFLTEEERKQVKGILE